MSRLGPKTAGALVALLAALVYLPTVRNGYVWDDGQYVKPLVELSARELPRALRSDLYAVDPSDAPSGYHRPLASLTLWLNGHLGGAAALHAGNVALHALAAALLVLLIIGRLGREATVPAMLAALLWALHPESSETVAWISTRYDLLTAVFALLLLLLPWRAGWARAALHGLIFFCGLLCKEGFVALFAVVIVDDWAARRPLRAAMPRVLSVSLSIAVWMGLRALLSIGTIAPPLGGAWRQILSAVAIYLGRAVWPLPLTISHPYVSLPPLGLAIGAATATALVGMALRARHLAPAVALILAPLGAQALAMGLLGIAPERYFYLPSVGLAFIAAALLLSLAGRRRSFAIWCGAFALAAALGAVAIESRLPDWRDDRALFTSAAVHDPSDPLANLYLGISAGLEGHPEESKRLLRRARERAPENARIANALAWAELKSGDGEAAKAEARRAVSLNPRLPQARLTLASAYHLTGAHFAERVEVEQALKLSPRFREARISRILANCEVDRRALCEADLVTVEREEGLDEALSLVIRVDAALRRGDLVLATERIDELGLTHPADPRLPVLRQARDAQLLSRRRPVRAPPSPGGGAPGSTDGATTPSEGAVKP